MKRRSTATSRRKASISTAKRGQPSARSAQHPTAPATVKIVFVAVRGRARLRVEGIRGRPASAAGLQAHIAGAPGIRQAHASSTTGNILVLFDPAKIRQPLYVRGPKGYQKITKPVFEKIQSGELRV